jgi:hypothetical protein
MERRKDIALLGQTWLQAMIPDGFVVDIPKTMRKRGDFKDVDV